MRPIRFFALTLLLSLPACAMHDGMRAHDRGAGEARAPHPIAGRPATPLSPMAVPFPVDPLHNVEHFAKDLNLTDDQMKQIENVRKDFAREEIKLRSNLDIAYLDLRDMTHQDQKDLNRDQIMRKVEEIGSLQTTLAKKNVEAGLSLTSILNEEQFKKFAELLREENTMGRGGRGSRFSDENY